MQPNHFAYGRIESFALEFDHRSTFLAHHVVVRWITVVVIEDRARSQLDSTKQPRIDQFGQGSINGRTTDVLSRRFEVFNQLFDIEMRMAGKNVFEQFALLFGEPLRLGTTGQILPEFVLRGLRHRNGGQRHGNVSEE